MAKNKRRRLKLCIREIGLNVIEKPRVIAELAKHGNLKLNLIIVMSSEVFYSTIVVNARKDIAGIVMPNIGRRLEHQMMNGLREQ